MGAADAPGPAPPTSPRARTGHPRTTLVRRPHTHGGGAGDTPHPVAVRAGHPRRRGGPALDPTVERLRHLKDAFTKVADASRARTDRYAEQDDADAVHPVCQDEQQSHRPHQPGPRRGREAGR
ncbi:hypothetical protein [Streptomyces olivaceoviridis]|uniref:hypothetical protein n=1 Tax=Streptomyces olivaceoviridis TaxID=1921 RepID=UPI0036F6C47A